MTSASVPRYPVIVPKKTNSCLTPVGLSDSLLQFVEEDHGRVRAGTLFLHHDPNASIDFGSFYTSEVSGDSQNKRRKAITLRPLFNLINQ